MACGFVSPESYRHVHNESFTTGELLEYQAHYGFLKIGEGIVDVSPALVTVNKRVCYMVTLSGKTSGTFDMVYKVRDTWRSFIDTSAVIPQQFYMNLHENKYHKEETVYFDHTNKIVRTEEKEQQAREFNIPDHVQDLISGFYYLRTIDFNQLHPGEIIAIPAFFDKTFYEFKVRYCGKGKVVTKFGKIEAIQLTPIMPANGLFKNENAIKLWISDDLNKIPVKVEADMFIGSIELELKKFKGLKHALNIH